VLVKHHRQHPCHIPAGRAPTWYEFVQAHTSPQERGCVSNKPGKPSDIGFTAGVEPFPNRQQHELWVDGWPAIPVPRWLLVTITDADQPELYHEGRPPGRPTSCLYGPGY